MWTLKAKIEVIYKTLNYKGRKQAVPKFKMDFVHWAIKTLKLFLKNCQYTESKLQLTLTF